MSQPRRRRSRRRRRKGGPAQAGQGTQQEATGQQKPGGPQPQGETGNGRKRRRRGRGGSKGPPRFKSSEDLVRSFLPAKPTRMEGQGDGTTLEQVIGDLQSENGVPQYPQEYRITLKVAEDRPSNGRERASARGPSTQPEDDPVPEGGSKREKAPAAPRMPSSSSGDGSGEGKRRRRRGRRGRKRSRGPDGDPSDS